MRELHFATRRAWRAWLERRHALESGIWMVFYKPAKGVTYAEAVEEALCFGWIDSVIHRLDDKRYARKFTPRKSTGHWSAINLERIRRLKRAGLVTDAGLVKLGKNVRAYVPLMQRRMAVPVDLRRALARNPKARQHFADLAPSYRRHYVAWIATARKDETRARRVRQAIARLMKNKTLREK